MKGTQNMKLKSTDRMIMSPELDLKRVTEISTRARGQRIKLDHRHNHTLLYLADTRFSNKAYYVVHGDYYFDVYIGNKL